MDRSWVAVLSIQLPRCESRRSSGPLRCTSVFVAVFVCASAFVGIARAEDRAPPAPGGAPLSSDSTTNDGASASSTTATETSAATDATAPTDTSADATNTTDTSDATNNSAATDTTATTP